MVKKNEKKTKTTPKFRL